MTKQPFRFTFFVLMCLLIPLTATAQTVNIPDANLRAAIEKALGKTRGAAITAPDMSELTRLVAPNASINNLAGLEFATNLTELSLSGNSISDLSVLSGLTNLTLLGLDNNSISELSALSGLTNLVGLALNDNSISELPALSGLTNLIGLDLSGNTVSNITSLSGLTQLRVLYLRNNSISELSALSGLTNLIRLRLGKNSISDLSALVTNTGLKGGTSVNVSENPLSFVSINTHIADLQQRNVEITYDNRTPQSIRIVSGGDQEGNAGGALASPFVVEVRDGNSVAFEGVPVTFTVTSGGGTLSAASVATDSNGRAESTLTLGSDAGTNIVEVAVTGVQGKQTFSAEGVSMPKIIQLISGNNQEGLPGASLANPFVVEVQDQSDKPLPDVEVTFTVTSGGGTLSAASDTTDSNGRAESTLTLGSDAGTNTVAVSVTGIQEQQTFTAEGVRIPKAFWIITGDKQQGLIGEPLSGPIIVEVRDQSGAPMPDVEVTFSVSSGGGTLSVTSAMTDNDGRAESILTLGPDPGTNSVEVAVKGIQAKQTVTAIAELPPIPEDVNRDDIVNILDLVLVASALGTAGPDLAADVNGDGIVNILDLVLVAGALGKTAAAPAVIPGALDVLTARDVRAWLTQAQELDVMDVASRRGVLLLEQLLEALTPKETVLLSNYPNPFNPETWIPYRLAEDSAVVLTIYDIAGIAVRRLDLGHQMAGYYDRRSHAIYWDGRNDFGEQAASGVYFYHLSTGDYSATRKMLIRK